MKPHYRLTYRESTTRGRKIAWLIPLRGSKYIITFPQGPCGYCDSELNQKPISESAGIDIGPLSFAYHGYDRPKEKPKPWWQLW